MKTLLVSALLLFCTQAFAQDNPSQKRAPVSGNHRNRSSKKLIGHLAPDFDLPTIAGDELKLSDLRGKAVLLNFWATYCDTCKIDMPRFVELQNEYGPQGFQIVAVAMDDHASVEDIAEFTRAMNLNYTVVLGNGTVENSYDGLRLLPTTFFLDRDGKIIAREFGLQSRGVYVKHIKMSLGDTVGAQK
jgi:thiol-disulfide isomerase/thioredoxin